MAKRIHFLVLVACLVGVATLGRAQNGRQSQNGTITVRVACHCQLISSDKPNQPLHFTAIGNVWRDIKQVQIASNCRWNLRVVSSKTSVVSPLSIGGKNSKKGKKPEPEIAEADGQIIYTVKKVGGTGSLVNPQATYILGQETTMPEGLGELKLDVVFEMTGKVGKNGPGNDNTWVSFYVLPKE